MLFSTIWEILDPRSRGVCRVLVSSTHEFGRKQGLIVSRTHLSLYFHPSVRLLCMHIYEGRGSIEGRTEDLVGNIKDIATYEGRGYIEWQG